MTAAGGFVARLRRVGPELVLAAVAVLAFVVGLGAKDLWGKREQRAAAETLDTIQKDHWLVAQIQGRPRLEKPPLPRWITAALMTATGRHDEAIVRLPNAAGALGMIALTYALGYRWGGRRLALCAGLMLASFVYYAIEMRQAGNDGMLAFWATLALYAAWRRRDGGGAWWARLTWIALGLGFLTKGPVIWLLVALTVIPAALLARDRGGLKSLLDGWGVLLCLALSASWPVAVVLHDPNAPRVWLLEMAMKAGTTAVVKADSRELLLLQWPGMMAPWLVPAALGIALPWLRGRQVVASRPALWYAWCWANVNLAMFCLWHVAKTNYYMPCMPGVALLAGWGWLAMLENARGVGRSAWWSRFAIRAHLVAFALLAIVGLGGVATKWPGLVGWVALAAAGMLAGVALAAVAWRQGRDVRALAGLAGGMAWILAVGAGAIAPAFNEARGFRTLAQELERHLPPEARTVHFMHELDEGLWFFLTERDLKPIPGTQPDYSDAADLHEQIRIRQAAPTVAERIDSMRSKLLDWVSAQTTREYFLVRRRDLLVFRADPAFRESFRRHAREIYGEPPRARNELILLRTRPRANTATIPPTLR